MANIRAVDVVVDTLRRKILSGELPAGERLPPERAFCESLGVSRLTLRAALSRLEAENLLIPRQGAGTTVQDWRTRGGVGLLPFLLEHDHTHVVASMLQLRRAVAVEAAATATTTATDAQLEALEAKARELAEEHDPSALIQGNLDFSRMILGIGGNVAFQMLFNSVERVYQANPELALLTHTQSDAMRASFGALVLLLRTREPEHVREVLRASLEALDAETVRRLEARPSSV